MIDSPKISYADAESIQRCAKHASMLGRELITQTELVTSLFHTFHGCESDFGIEQCVAQMPNSMHGEILLRAQKNGTEHHPGNLFVFQPNEPTTDELLELDERVRHIIRVVTRYLANPTGNVAYSIDENDLPRKRWFAVMHFDTIADSKCKNPVCNNDRVKFGVFCPAHHYEMLYGNPPPNAG